MKRVLATVLAVSAACVFAGVAAADGDPASDYLLAQKVFVPFDLKVPKAKQDELTAVVDAANRGGFPIRVAVIGSAYDMGAITSLWRKPRSYARFLGEELAFVYKNRLLIVMPNGFGFYRPGRPTTKEYAGLATVPIGSGAVGLVDSAGAAVRKLAAQEGVAVGNPSPASSSNRNTRDRVLIIVIAAAALLGTVLLRLVLRRRRQ